MLDALAHMLLLTLALLVLMPASKALDQWLIRQWAAFRPKPREPRDIPAPAATTIETEPKDRAP